mmetsp:Transcript_15960/g.36520  ORF Transcript_15960/g.36520 Transcript_15960/m.36520 type:complete len:90 (+) Transcript_15960:18-287(+)
MRRSRSGLSRRCSATQSTEAETNSRESGVPAWLPKAIGIMGVLGWRRCKSVRTCSPQPQSECAWQGSEDNTPSNSDRGTMRFMGVAHHT